MRRVDVEPAAPDGNKKRECRRDHVVSIHARTASVHKMAPFATQRNNRISMIRARSRVSSYGKKKRERSSRISRRLKPMGCESLKRRRLHWVAPEVERHGSDVAGGDAGYLIFRVYCFHRGLRFPHQLASSIWVAHVRTHHEFIAFGLISRRHPL